MNNQRHICILTSAHMALDVRIFYKEATSLSSKGYNVTLIAQHERNENLTGIKIIALKPPQNRFSRMLISTWTIYKIAKKQNADIYHFHDPELIPVGLLLNTSKKKVIYDVHEDLPAQIMTKEWIPQICRRPLSFLLKYFESFAARRFDAIITTSQDISDRFIVSNSNTAAVLNYPLLQEITHIAETDSKSSDANCSREIKKIVALGGVSEDRSIVQIIKAIALLPKELKIELLIGGDCQSTALLKAISLFPGWEHATYRGILSREEALNTLQNSDISLVIYSPAPNHYDVRSNRLFESMAAGVPVVTSNFPRWKEFILSNKCGLVADPLSPKDIADAITLILQDPDTSRRMGTNGKNIIEKKYNWEKEAEKLLGVYERLFNAVQ